VARLLRSSDLILHTTSYLERFNRCFRISTTYAAPLLTQDYIYNTAVLTQPLATQAAGATDKPGRRMGRARSDRRRAYSDYKFASYHRYLLQQPRPARDPLKGVFQIRGKATCHAERVYRSKPGTAKSQ